jgi:hypothetical protein
LDGEEEEDGLEEVDGEDAVAEEADAGGDDQRRKRHAGGVEADGIAGCCHAIGAGGEASAVEEALGGGADEIREIEEGIVGLNVVEGEDRRERDDESNQQDEKKQATEPSAFG